MSRTTSATVFGVLISAALVIGVATRPCQITGTVTIDLAQHTTQGWSVVDHAWASANVSARLMDLPSRWEATSDTVWTGTSEKGRALKIRWTGPVRATFDRSTGIVQASITFDASIAGAHLVFPVTLSTEPGSSPIGPLQGRRATVANHALSTLVAGSAILRDQHVLSQFGTGAGLPDQVLVVIRADGRAAIQ